MDNESRTNLHGTLAGELLSRRTILAAGSAGLATLLTGTTFRPANAQQETPPPSAGTCRESSQSVESRSPALSGNPVERWKVDISEGNPPRLAVGGEHVFAADNDARLLALDAATGRERWRVSLDGDGGTPVVVDELVLIDDGGRGLIALDTGSGEERWRFDERASFAAAAVCEGQIVAGGDAGLFALDTKSGAERWSLLTGTPHGRPVTNGALIASMSDDGVLYAVEAGTGEVRWSVPYGGADRTLALDAERVFAAVERGPLGERVGTLTAFDVATGTEQWSRELSERLQGRPVVDGERLYLGVGKSLIAFAVSSGDEVWRVEAGSILATLAVAGTTIYLAAGNGAPVDGTSTLVALDAATGVEQWRMSLGYVMVAAPAVKAGLLVAGSADPYLGGSIVAFGE